MIVTHRDCGKPAAKKVGRRPYQVGALLSATDFEHLDGRAYKPNQVLQCDSCGHYVTLVVNKNGALVAKSVTLRKILKG